MKLRLIPLCILFSGAVMAQNVNVKFRSQLKYPGQSLANICGYVDKTGKEYALVGASKGMSIVDVSNPDKPLEVKFIDGPVSKWKEIKVRGNYAYIACEEGNGLQIVNMGSLPSTTGITYKTWKGDGAIANSLGKIHALHIDDKYAYLFGSNLYGGGPVVVDLTDPYNPKYVGKYQNSNGNYVHDGYVRNDTLYACHIYDGFCSIVDFRKKTAPVILGSVITPGKFTHNSWLTEDSKTMFTTDEVSNSFVTAYDISNPKNIEEIDRIQSNPGSKSTVHNVHVLKVGDGEYAVTSWYRDGFTIVDVTRPKNMVQVGNYDTYSGSGGGFNGAWGVYPFLPSGTILVSNIEDGLFVFTPTYQRACYFEGVVTDSLTGIPINGATITVQSTSFSLSSSITGEYSLGMVPPGGTYTVTYSKTGYRTKTLNNVKIASGIVNIQNVQLVPKSFSVGENVLDDAILNTYPNPFTNELTISYEFPNRALTGAAIKVTDMIGRIIDDVEINQSNGKITLNPQVNAGVYFVRIVNGPASSLPIKIIKVSDQ